MSYLNQSRAIGDSFAGVVLPPPDLNVDVWSVYYRYLSAESSAEPGKYDLSRTPHCRFPMELLSPSHPCKRVLLPWSSQIAKTTVVENFIGYIIDMDPGPILVVQPNAEPMGRVFSTDRLAPMLRDTPRLHGKVRDSDKRNSGNTLKHKVFPRWSTCHHWCE